MELAVVIPTFNERENVTPLVERLHRILENLDWEAIFVDDDSSDGTAEKLRELSRKYPRVRCIRRIGRRGLSSACVEGMLSSHADYFAVMDADLQHDESLLPAMLALLKSEPCDLVIGTRYMEGGSVGEWQNSRRNISQIATRIGQRVLGVKVQDPMSGFFMVRREVIETTVRQLSSIGFKILLDLIVSASTPLRIRELPFHFGQRLNGESKLDIRNIWDYMLLIADKTIGRYVPVQLVSFGAIGSLGVLVHLAALSMVMSWFGWSFWMGQTIAVVTAMVFNFYLNNSLTYRDQRLSGWRWFWGLVKFLLACSVGAMANVGVASYLFHDQTGWLLSSLAGILVGLVWNYTATSILVWSGRKS
jgi:dolichol-phosphate mannosyltransferase